MSDSPLIAKMRAMVREELARAMAPKRGVVGYRVSATLDDEADRGDIVPDGDDWKWYEGSKRASKRSRDEAIALRDKANAWLSSNGYKPNARLVTVARKVKP